MQLTINRIDTRYVLDNEGGGPWLTFIHQLAGIIPSGTRWPATSVTTTPCCATTCADTATRRSRPTASPSTTSPTISPNCSTSWARRYARRRPVDRRHGRADLRHQPCRQGGFAHRRRRAGLHSRRRTANLRATGSIRARTRHGEYRGFHTRTLADTRLSKGASRSGGTDR